MNDEALSVADHRRDRVGLTYIYPVVSRRAAGVSIGINLNINQACNWACVYCQVEGLTRGGPPSVDVCRLTSELRGFLRQVLQGSYLQQHVPETYRQLADLAFSGDGEPTSALEFPEVVTRVGEVLADFDLLKKIPVRLITNGSLIHRPYVQDGLARLADIGGEVWFKVDRADSEGMLAINHSRLSLERVNSNLRYCGSVLPTWVQTCWFSWDGMAPQKAAREAYLDLIEGVAGMIRGIHLYGLARPSCQPEAMRLGRLEVEEMENWAEEIRQKTGVKVNVSP